MRKSDSIRSNAGNALVIVLIVLLLIAAVGGAAYYFLVLNRPAEESEETDNGDNGPTTQVPVDPDNPVDENIVGEDAVSVVTYDGKDFNPETVDVPVGGTVKFVNGSDKDMWVASNPHPIHTGLSGFDSKEAIKPGGTYTFTFEKEGEFGYHNHLNFFQGGTVNVVAE